MKECVAGFWMSSPTTLSYQVEDESGHRVTMEVAWDTKEQATAQCPKAIRAITESARREGYVSSRQAAYLTATADLICDWVMDKMVAKAQPRIKIRIDPSWRHTGVAS